MIFFLLQVLNLSKAALSSEIALTKVSSVLTRSEGVFAWTSRVNGLRSKPKIRLFPFLRFNSRYEARRKGGKLELWELEKKY